MSMDSPVLHPGFSKNSLAYWFPLLEALHIPVPKTIIVKTNLQLDGVLDGEPVDGYDAFIADLRQAAADVSGGKPPVFLRTGETSAKHQWLDTCYVTDFDTMWRNVFSLIEASALMDIIGLPTDVWAVREMLDVPSTFAAFNGFPVTREMRYFIRDGAIECRHPYWPEAALKGRASITGDNLHQEVERMNTIEDGDMRTLDEYALTIAKHMRGYWSLDFLQTADMKWVATDMALGDLSFHWPGCGKVTRPAQ